MKGFFVATCFAIQAAQAIKLTQEATTDVAQLPAVDKEVIDTGVQAALATMAAFEGKAATEQLPEKSLIQQAALGQMGSQAQTVAAGNVAITQQQQQMQAIALGAAAGTAAAIAQQQAQQQAIAVTLAQSEPLKSTETAEAIPAEPVGATKTAEELKADREERIAARKAAKEAKKAEKEARNAEKTEEVVTAQMEPDQLPEEPVGSVFKSKEEREAAREARKADREAKNEADKEAKNEADKEKTDVTTLVQQILTSQSSSMGQSIVLAPPPPPIVVIPEPVPAVAVAQEQQQQQAAAVALAQLREESIEIVADELPTADALAEADALKVDELTLAQWCY